MNRGAVWVDCFLPHEKSHPGNIRGFRQVSKSNQGKWEEQHHVIFNYQQALMEVISLVERFYQ